MTRRPALGQDAGQHAGQDAREQETVLDDKIQAHLGTMIQRHYDDIVSAPIPDQFLVLLAELEARERSNGS